jgi:hypothetical protein
MGDTYPYWGAPQHEEARVPIPGSLVRQTSGEIPSARAQSLGRGVTTWFVTLIS